MALTVVNMARVDQDHPGHPGPPRASACATPGPRQDPAASRRRYLMTPLNPRLHARLVERFGRVGISNDGQALQVTHMPDYVHRKGRLKAHVSSWGETYKVNCPFCSDTRGRLYISHRWGVRDPRTGDDLLHLAFCHNEECLRTREAQKQLHKHVFPDGRYAFEVASLTSASVTPSAPTPP